MFAQLVFETMDNPDVISWNSLITGYAWNGHGNEAVALFEQMLLEGVTPDEVTFVGVLSACSHGGLIDQGTKYFRKMTEMFAIKPLAEHYSCMVDLFSRAGKCEEAFEIACDTNTKENAGLWGALLGACRKHQNLRIAKLAAEKLLELESNKTSNYVLTSSINAEVGNWDEAEKARISIMGSGAEKQAGCSWIELGNQVYIFVSNDQALPKPQEIYTTLNSLAAKSFVSCMA